MSDDLRQRMTVEDIFNWLVMNSTKVDLPAGLVSTESVKQAIQQAYDAGRFDERNKAWRKPDESKDR